MLFVLGRFVGCTHPAAQLAGVALLIAGFVYLVAAAILRKPVSWAIVAACVVLLMSAAWVGSLRYSPLGFGTPRLPLFSQFEIRRVNSAPVALAPGGIVSVAAGSPAQIYPKILPGPVDCLWSASAGGALDDPGSCDTVYVAARGVPFEVLRLRVRSGCGLPPAVAQIKISILP